MKKATGIAKAAIAAGLALTCVFGGISPALADGMPAGEYGSEYATGDALQSTGQTKLYVTGAPGTSIVGDGVDGQLRVTIPVGIHFAAMSDGTLIGPSDGTVLFQNNSDAYDVHVSQIGVVAANDTAIMELNNNLGNDQVYVSMTPTQGTLENGVFKASEEAKHAESLGFYTTAKSPDVANKFAYDMAKNGGVVALNKIHGKIGGFDKLNPATETQIGTVNWVVRAGTRAKADERDGTCTVHFHANGGMWEEQALADQSTVVLEYDKLPKVVAGTIFQNKTISSGEGLLSKLTVGSDGSVVACPFKGWYLTPNPTKDDQAITKFGDLGTAEEIAGKTIVLYAAYEG